MIRKFLAAFTLCFVFACAAVAMAQDIPADAGLDAPAKAALTKMIGAAAQEGSLTYADTIIQPTTNDLLVKAFLKYYGLPASYKVNYTLLSSEAMITRVDQEFSAGKVTFDVAAVGSPTWAFEKYAAGDFMEYHSPQYPFYQAAFDAGLGVDGYFIFNGGFAQIPIWNTQVLNFKGKSYKDALAAAVPGRFSIGDAAHSASHLTTYAGLRQVLGVDFFKAMAAKKPTFIGRSELSAQRVISGQDVIAFGGNPSRVLQSNKKGAKLKILYPSEGFTFLPQETFILKQAPHPNSAKLWLDFILSETGQEMLARNEALISGRAGFKSPYPDIAPSFASLKIIKVDWRKMTAAQLTKYRTEWISIFNP
jgi:iron(III) transport system substrate-binding protein